MGVGTLAGSTIMLLSIAWGGSLIAGRCDLSERVSADILNLSPDLKTTFLLRKL